MQSIRAWALHLVVALNTNQYRHTECSHTCWLPSSLLCFGRNLLRLGRELQVDRIDDKSGSEQSRSDDSTSASDEEADDTPASTRKRAASTKARAAALDILQGGTEQGEEEGMQPRTGLFSLPFMTRAAERQRLNAQQEAAAVLAQLEAEDEEAAAGSEGEAGAAAEPQGWEAGSGNAGRMSFGAGPASAHQVYFEHVTSIMMISIIIIDSIVY